MNKILEHKHIIIRAEVSQPITNRNKAIKFLNRIIKAIDMKAMYGPTATYCKMPGNKGVTAPPNQEHNLMSKRSYQGVRGTKKYTISKKWTKKICQKKF